MAQPLKCLGIEYGMLLARVVYSLYQPTSATGQPKWEHSQTGKWHVSCLCIFLKIILRVGGADVNFCVVRERPDDSVLFHFFCCSLCLRSLAHPSALKLISLLLFLQRVCFWRFFLRKCHLFFFFFFCIPERHSFLILLNKKNGRAENRGTKRSEQKKCVSVFVWCLKRNVGWKWNCVRQKPNWVLLCCAKASVWQFSMVAECKREDPKNRWWHTTCLVDAKIIHFFFLIYFLLFRVRASFAIHDFQLMRECPKPVQKSERNSICAPLSRGCCHRIVNSVCVCVCLWFTVRCRHHRAQFIQRLTPSLSTVCLLSWNSSITFFCYFKSLFNFAFSSHMLAVATVLSKVFSLFFDNFLNVFLLSFATTYDCVVVVCIVFVYTQCVLCAVIR